MVVRIPRRQVVRNIVGWGLIAVGVAAIVGAILYQLLADGVDRFLDCQIGCYPFTHAEVVSTVVLYSALVIVAVGMVVRPRRFRRV